MSNIIGYLWIFYILLLISIFSYRNEKRIKNKYFVDKEIKYFLGMIINIILSSS